MRGGLTTLDRDYGWINNIHHDIGTHVIHHLFPQIPHYHLVEAVSNSIHNLHLTNDRNKRFLSFRLDELLIFLCILTLQTEAAKPVLGKYYREPKRSWPLPFHLLGSLIRSMKEDHYVSDTGDVVYYQTDPKLNGSPKAD